MSLPTMPRKPPRPIAVTVRLSEATVEMLKGLAKAHNLSQADVVEHLVKEEYQKYSDKKNAEIDAKAKKKTK